MFKLCKLKIYFCILTLSERNGRQNICLFDFYPLSCHDFALSTRLEFVQYVIPLLLTYNKMLREGK